jgi:hypothetical protein
MTRLPIVAAARMPRVTATTGSNPSGLVAVGATVGVTLVSVLVAMS